MRPYYADDSVTLYHGDCREVMSEWISEFATPDFGQIVVTSPPYNMGASPGGGGRGIYRTSKSAKGSRFRDGYEGIGDFLDRHEYDSIRREELALMWQLVPDDGAVFWNHRQRVEHGLARLPLDMDFPAPLRQIITWDRGTGIGVNRRHFAAVAEWVFLFAKPEFQLASHSSSGFGDVWRLGMAGADAGDHPAAFPVKLPLRAIQYSGARSVLDPYSGSGSTLVAAKLAGIRGVGIEISERYCEIAAKRLTQDVLDFEGAS